MALCGILWTCYFFYVNKSTQSLKKEEVLDDKYPRPKYEFTGMNYGFTYKGEKAISIEAARLRVQKMKIGFFRFGLINEARFDNATIRIYRRQYDKQEPSGKENVIQGKNIGNYQYNKPESAGNENVMQGKNIGGYHFPDFKEVFKDSQFIPIKKEMYSSVIMSPVCLEIYDDDKIVTEITAGFCKIKAIDMIMEFSGNVRVKSGEKVLMTSKLKATLKKGEITTNDQYQLQTLGKTINGKNITTDIYLKQVK